VIEEEANLRVRISTFAKRSETDAMASVTSQISPVASVYLNDTLGMASLWTIARRTLNQPPQKMRKRPCHARMP
jgi:hypothetical protein